MNTLPYEQYDWAAGGNWLDESTPTPDSFDLNSFDMGGFDMNAAFQDALLGTATDAELVIEEKVRRIENIIEQGNSEIYNDFVDFRAMASQIEMMCAHDHALGQALQGSQTVGGFMDNHNAEDGNGHGSCADARTHADEDAHEKPGHKDSKKNKKSKKKKFSGWLFLFSK